METRASYILVGSFVLGLFAAIFGIAFWIAGLEVGQKPVKYVTYFTGDVTGLGVGSPVRYRGVPMGTVRDIRLDPNNIEQVRVLMELSTESPIKEDTVAEISLQGITGVAFVQLSGGTQAAPPLVGKNGQIPIIPSTSSLLQEVIGKLPQFLGKAVVIADHLNELLSKKNLSAVSVSLANLQYLTEMLRSDTGDLRMLLRDGRGAAVTLGEAATELRTLAGSVNSKIGPLFNASEKTIADISKAAANVRKITDGIQALVNDNRGPLRDFSQTGLYEFTQFISEARVLVDSLTRLVNRIERDPSHFLFGDSQRGVRAP
jgi:phospholipid/cholesterol/gamma-HCH transport system substrate-binding protein